MASVTVRPFVDADLEAALVIERATYPTPWTPGIFADELKAPGRTYLAAPDRLAAWTETSRYRGIVAAMQHGAILPPVTLYLLDGHYYILDGHHRVAASRQLGILDVDAEGRVDRARFVLEGFVKEIEYVLKYTHDRPHILSWVAEESDDLKMLEGSYRFEATDDGATEVVYSLTVEPKFILPGFVKRQAEKQIVTTALRGLRRRVARIG